MFDYEKLEALNRIIKKAQFVPMDPSMAGGDPNAVPPPGDPNAMPPPGDPNAMPPPGDPNAMPPPGDPNAMPPPMDPAMMAGDPSAIGMPPMDQGEVSPSGEPYMKITPTQLSKLFKQFAEVFKSVLGIQTGAPGTPGAPAAVAQAPASDPALSQKMTELDAKIDALLRG